MRFRRSRTMTADIDAVTAATIEATAVRVLLAAGDIFAGRPARPSLLTMTARAEPAGPDADLLPRIVALTAHLRVLAAAGDLELAEGSLQAIAGAGTAGAAAASRAARAADLARRACAGPAAIARRAASATVWPHPARGSRAAASGDRAATGRYEARASPRSHVVPSPPARVASSGRHARAPGHDEESDRRALERVAGRLARDLSDTRIDLVSCDAGAGQHADEQGRGSPDTAGQRARWSRASSLAKTVDGGGHEIGDADPPGQPASSPRWCAGGRSTASRLPHAQPSCSNSPPRLPRRAPTRSWRRFARRRARRRRCPS